MVDSTGTSSWTYDNADNVTQLVTPQGTMNYVYDVWNRRSKLTEGSVDTIYTYTNEKLTNIAKSADSVSTTLSYDSYGRLITKNDGATSTTYGYDANDRLNDIAHANSSGTFHQEHYTYDYANNLTTKIVNSVATSYTYDSIDQLLTENGGGLANTYGYDANGNRTSKISTAGTEILSYDAADKLLTRSGVGATSYYYYDNCGRTTSIQRGGVTKTLTWDYEDRLTNIVAGTIPSTNYTYNGVGTRVSKSNSIGSRTYKRDGVGVTAPVLSDGLASIVPGISEKTGSTTSFVHSDHLSSMKALSSSGAVTDTASYDAFGNVVSRTGTNATQKGFAGGFGYQEDGESGYKLLGHRYYDPETGRFLSRDRAMDGPNWYCYVFNNPLRAIDSAGLSGREIGAVVGGLIGGCLGTGVASIFTGAAGAAVGSFIGSLFDGDGAEDAVKNAAMDGLFALAFGYAFSKLAPFMGRYMGSLGRLICSAGCPKPGAGGALASDVAVSAEQMAAARLAQNAANGKAYEKEVLADLIRMGINAKMFKQAVNTPLGRRIPDIAVYEGDKVIYFIECKFGNAVRSEMQEMKDLFIEITMGLPTIVMPRYRTNRSRINGGIGHL